MPIYPIRAPDGTIFRLKGDSPPTEQEIEQAYAVIPKTSQTPQDLNQSLQGALMLQPSAQSDQFPALGFPRGGRSSVFTPGLGFEEEARAEAFASKNPLRSSIVDVARPSLNILGGLAGSTPLTSAILTPGSQSVADLIEAALGDPQSPQLQQLSRRTTPEYLQQRGLEAALGGAAAKAGELIPAAVSGGFRKLTTAGSRPEVLEQAAKAADLGIDLPVGSATGAPILTGAEKFLSRAPLTRGKVANIFEDVGKQLDDATQTKLLDFSTPIPDAEAGTKVGDTIQGVYKQGLEANEINYRAVPKTFSNPTQSFPLSNQQSKALELWEREMKLSPENRNDEVINRLKQSAGIDKSITPEILDGLDDAAKMELVEKFVPKKNIKGTLESLSTEQRRVYGLLPASQRDEFLAQMASQSTGTSPGEAVNQLVGKPLDKIINTLSPESKAKLLEAITPNFEWDTLIRERGFINETIQDLKNRGKGSHATTLNKLAQSLREDMGDIAASQGKAATDAFKKADQEYQEFVRIFQDNPKISKILTSTEPTAIREAVTGKGSVGFVKELKKVVGDSSEAFNVVKRKYAEDFLSGGKVDDDTLKEVFGSDAFKDLTEFKKTADFVRSKTPGKVPDNFSVGNPNVISLGVGGVGYLAGGVPGALGTAATTQVIAPMALSRAFLSPSGRKLILEGSRTPTKSAKGAKIATRLAAILAGEEMIEPEQEDPDLNTSLSNALKK